jgi:hypothetical protein
MSSLLRKLNAFNSRRIPWVPRLVKNYFEHVQDWSGEEVSLLHTKTTEAGITEFPPPSNWLNAFA